MKIVFRWTIWTFEAITGHLIGDWIKNKFFHKIRNKSNTSLNIEPPFTKPYEISKPKDIKKPIRKILYQKNKNFTGRDNYLQQLKSTLDIPEQFLPITQIITGLGGIGKTQLALEHTYDRINDYNVIWWIRAEEPSTMRTDYLEISDEIGLEILDKSNQNELMKAVKNWFETHSNWLLVFDNACSQQEIEEYLPNSETGHIIITTRDEILEFSRKHNQDGASDAS